ncbi:MAG TPA: hypothetical protein VNI84_04625 [Pyrinomonadaceae bacterium]|nr:hypothetical protein [Pyrinomonadaceae bacterium]
MSLEYENRKGEKHYVKWVKTRKGGTRYYIVKNKRNPGELLDEMPQGFEFYEFPFDALVTFRKIKKSNITDEEFSILDSVMKRHETVKEYIIDREENALTLYISGDYGEIRSFLRDEDFRKMQQYDEKLRFEKNKNSGFRAQRFCFISKYYGWIAMETSEDLKYLAEKYCPHADKESLLEFWIEGEEEPETALVGEISGIPVYGYE